MLVLFLKSYCSFPTSVERSFGRVHEFKDPWENRVQNVNTQRRIRNVTAIIIRSWGKSISDKMVAVYNPVRLLSSSLPPCSLESLSYRAHGGKRYLKASTCRHNVCTVCRQETSLWRLIVALARPSCTSPSDRLDSRPTLSLDHRFCVSGFLRQGFFS